MCVPGNGLCKECFDEWVDATCCDRGGDKESVCWAIQIDLTGHGHSRKKPAEWEDDEYMWRYGVDILACIDAFAAEFSFNREFTFAVSHSMGAKASVWAAVLRRNVFDRLILVEPIVFPRIEPAPPLEVLRQVNPMYIMTMKRKRAFKSFDDAIKSYKGRSIFAQWTLKSLENYVRGGFEQVEDGSKVVLRCLPEWEAANFATNDNTLWENALKLKVPISCVMGEKSTNLDRIEPGTTTLDFYKKFQKAFNCELIVVKNTTHSLPMEAPGVAALSEIVRDKMKWSKQQKQAFIGQPSFL